MQRLNTTRTGLSATISECTIQPIRVMVVAMPICPFEVSLMRGPVVHEPLD